MFPAVSAHSEHLCARIHVFRCAGWARYRSAAKAARLKTRASSTGGAGHRTGARARIATRRAITRVLTPNGAESNTPRIATLHVFHVVRIEIANGVTLQLQLVWSHGRFPLVEGLVTAGCQRSGNECN